MVSLTMIRRSLDRISHNIFSNWNSALHSVESAISCKEFEAICAKCGYVYIKSGIFQ